MQWWLIAIICIVSFGLGVLALLAYIMYVASKDLP